MSKIVERFRIGGQPDGSPSIPSSTLSQALGTKIKVDIQNQVLIVPTTKGYKMASAGDTVVCFDDGSFDVEYWKEAHK